MACKPLPSQEVLRQLLDYDPATGLFTWKERDLEWFPSGAQSQKHNAAIWNGKNAGKPAFTTKLSTGYMSAGLLGVTRTAQRVAWKWMTGEEADTVDHINGDKADNRWSNLRSVPHAINGRNCKRSKNNTTGINGIGVDKRNGRWTAAIHVNYRKKYLGSFHCLGQAVRARRAAEKAHGFHENHGRAI